MSELRFDGRFAIVTGAGRGIGRGHALLLAQKGAHIVVADHGVDPDGNGTSSVPADEVARETASTPKHGVTTNRGEDNDR